MTYSIQGYLYVTHQNPNVQEFSQLGEGANMEMGRCLKLAAGAVETILNSKNMLVGGFGLVNGFQIHFHITPVYNRAIAALMGYPDYVSYQENTPKGYPAKPDGAELQAFIWREMHMQKARFVEFKHAKIATQLEEHIASQTR